MPIVSQLLQGKVREVWSIAPQAPVSDALRLMADKNIGALLVMEEGKLVGIFSERDYARNSILKGNSCLAGKIAQLMTGTVFYVSPEDSIESCMALMTEKHIRHLPVMENGQVIGMLTPGDLVREIIADQKITIEQLERFITGDYKA
ncbi:MAG: CBS domain-containing protein [bacterium]